MYTDSTNQLTELQIFYREPNTSDAWNLTSSKASIPVGDSSPVH
jgi:hypothetical protein